MGGVAEVIDDGRTGLHVPPGDPESLEAALDYLMRDRTTLVIAHRLSTIIGANRIIVLKDGQVVESGTHEDLLSRRGSYHHLFEIQRKGMDTGGKENSGGGGES